MRTENLCCKKTLIKLWTTYSIFLKIDIFSLTFMEVLHKSLPKIASVFYVFKFALQTFARLQFLN